MVNVWHNYWKGSVRILLVSENGERFLRLCAENGISLYNLVKTKDGFIFNISAGDFFRLKGFRQKTNSHIRIIEKKGMPFFLRKHWKRKAFLLGIGVFCTLLYVLSLFIWDIRIEGNALYSSESFLKELEKEDVKCGILKNKLDCIKIAADIRELFPHVVWVSAKIEGTCLQIDVKENEDDYQKMEEQGEKLTAWDLTAEADGTILSIITRKGTPKVQPGAECKRGDILVSGSVEILNQDLQVERYEYVGADAEIKILRTYSYYDEFSMLHKVHRYQQKPSTYPYFRFFQKEFTLWNGKTEHAIVSKELTPVYLSKSFCLPVAYGSIQVQPYVIRQERYSKEEATNLAREHIQSFLKDLIAQGAWIQNENLQVKVGPQKCVTTGKVFVIEEAGKKTPIQELDLNSDNS